MEENNEAREELGAQEGGGLEGRDGAGGEGAGAGAGDAAVKVPGGSGAEGEQVVI